MNTRIITLTFTEPCVLKLEVPATTAFSVAGEEKPGQTPGIETVQDMKKVYDDARILAGARLDEKKDFNAVRAIRYEFLTKPNRDAIAAALAVSGVNGDEFLGLLFANGNTEAVKMVIYGGINSALDARGQA